MKIRILILFFSIISLNIFSQSDKRSKLKPMKIGFLYAYASNEYFFHDDQDYTYNTSTFKGQAFYNLGNWKKLKFELIVQPQVQFIKHQLINEQFVLPSEKNYLEKRAEFTQQKSMNIYGLEFGLVLRKNLFAKLDILATAGLGFTYINTRTERLAKGFTFIENFSLGIEHQFIKDHCVYLGTTIGHVSNLNFKPPNSGYNILGFEVSYSFYIN